MTHLAVPEASVAAPAPAGRGELTVIRAGDGRSLASHVYSTSPLRLLTPRNAGHAAWIYMSSHGGGLVDGDRVAVDLDVGAGATAFMSTQASTKVYRSAGGTSADLHARVGARSLLVMAPDPVVCFADSRYRQTQHLDLASDADLVLVDWLSSGRHARGERWAFREYGSRLRVRRAGRLVVHDALSLSADEGDLAARLGRFDVLGTVLLIGLRLADYGHALLARVAHIPVSRRGDVLLAAAPVGDTGCLLRFASTSFTEAHVMLRDVLRFIPPLLGDDPWARKW